METLLGTFTLSYIHDKVRHCESSLEAAERLGTSNQALEAYLDKFVYEGKSLTFQILHDLSVQEAENTWDKGYKKVILNNCPVYHIHAAMRSSRSLAKAAQKLEVDVQTLGRHLGKFRHHGKPLTFQILHNLSVEKAKIIWGATYYQPMVAQKMDLKKCPIFYIHDIIRISKSLNDAALKLGVASETLGNQLRKFIYNDKPLTFQILHNLSVEKAKTIWGSAYDKPMFLASSLLQPLSQKDKVGVPKSPEETSLENRKIHSRATEKPQTSEPSPFQPRGEHDNKPDVEQSQLNQEPFDQLQNWLFSEENQQNPPTWDTATYMQPMAVQEVDLNKYPVFYIHDMIRNSGSLAEAAQKLGVADETLGSHLENFLYGPLTFQRLHNLSVQEAKVIWGPTYNQPLALTATASSLPPLNQTQLSEPGTPWTTEEHYNKPDLEQNHLNHDAFDQLESWLLSNDNGVSPSSSAPNLPDSPRLFKPSKKRARDDHNNPEENQQNFPKQPKK